MKTVKKRDKKQCMEFGQVATLIMLFLALHYKSEHFVTGAFVLLLVTVLLPILFYPLAILWFGLSELLGKISPVILLTIVFFLVVTPVGLIRSLLGKDTLRLKAFKKDRRSVMVDRNHLYTKNDLMHSF